MNLQEVTLTTYPHEHQPKGTRTPMAVEQVVAMEWDGGEELALQNMPEDGLETRTLYLPEDQTQRLHRMFRTRRGASECHSFAETLVRGHPNRGISTFTHSDLIPVEPDALAADRVYRIRDEKGRMCHSMVGLAGDPTRNIGVLGEWGMIAISDNREAIAAYGVRVEEAVFSGKALHRILSLL